MTSGKTDVTYCSTQSLDDEGTPEKLGELTLHLDSHRLDTPNVPRSRVVTHVFDIPGTEVTGTSANPGSLGPRDFWSYTTSRTTSPSTTRRKGCLDSDRLRGATEAGDVPASRPRHRCCEQPRRSAQGLAFLSSIRLGRATSGAGSVSVTRLMLVLDHRQDIHGDHGG